MVFLIGTYPRLRIRLEDELPEKAGKPACKASAFSSSRFIPNSFAGIVMNFHTFSAKLPKKSLTLRIGGLFFPAYRKLFNFYEALWLKRYRPQMLTPQK